MHRRRSTRTALLALLGALVLPVAPAAAVTAPGPAVEGESLVFADVALIPAYTVSGGTATAGVDFGDSSYNPLTQTLTVSTLQDNVDEPAETVVVRQGDDTVTGVIEDDDDTRLSVSNVRVRENAGTARVTLTLANPEPTAVDLTVVTRNGSASGGSDYAPVTRTVTLPPRQRSATVDVPIAKDRDDELDESFTVAATPTTDNVVPGEVRGTVTILNDDLRFVAVGDAGVRELDGDVAVMRFPVTLSAPTFRPVSVRFVTGDGTAIAPRDYLSRLGTLTIPPGQRTATIDVAVVGDNVKEPVEAFGLALTGATNATIVDGLAGGAIADDDGGDAPGGDDTKAPRVRWSKLKRTATGVSTRGRCPKAESVCTGRLTLYSHQRKAGSKLLKRGKRLGSKAYRIRGGRAKTVRVKLGRSTRRAARRAGRVRVRAFAVTIDRADNVATKVLQATLRY